MQAEIHEQAETLPTLGILAGGGELPARLIDACKSQNRPYFILGFEGAVDPELLDNQPHARVRLGAIGESLHHLHQAGVKELVMAGRLKRPSLATLRPDGTGARLLARLGKSFFAGDNSLLTAVIDYLEEEGFKVIGADEVLQNLLAPQGLIGRISPTKEAQKDIETGVRIGHAVGELDIGQAVIIQQGYVLGVEAAEGTDELISRCGLLKRNVPHGGVLIKVKKPSQERRVDLPTIGTATVENIAHAGFAGIAIEAGGALILDRQAVALKADALGVFVLGFTLEDTITQKDS
ncbi:MAG: UDP-2,3-diacylglucosamine diphosphatase LpxI [Alphaproteobacteria bacterium]|nr:UDP-2,3-diacylglucosamine diphosphatase LpxI [Alphaproteobacteria bacterium]